VRNECYKTIQDLENQIRDLGNEITDLDRALPRFYEVAAAHLWQEQCAHMWPNAPGSLSKYEFCIYALWKGVSIAYIGQTTQLQQRLDCHSKTKEFDRFTFTVLPSRVSIKKAEAIAIHAIHPPLNKLCHMCAFGAMPVVNWSRN
jgi:hypothetical protein